MADLAGKDVEKAKLHFDIYDFEGQGRIDAYKLGDVIRSLDLRPTNAAVEKAGGTKRRGEKWITLEEFLPIYSELKKNKDVGAYEDMVEGLKMYDKHENGLMMSAEMAHTLVALGERLESREVEEIMKACAGPSDIDGMIKYDSLGTIQDMEKIETHYKAIRPMESGLFTPEQRAPCIQYAYERAGIAPLNQIKFNQISMIGMIHDGVDHDKTMQVYGSVLRENKLKAELMEIEQQKPQIITKASRLPRNTIVERAMTPLFPSQSMDSGSAYGGSTMCSMSGGDSSLGYETDSGLVGCLNREEIYLLPSPDELSKTVAEAFHGSFVPIDVSGESFYRMASFRRSLTLADRKSRSKTLRRRNTICESQKIESKLISKRSSTRNNEAQSTSTSSADGMEKRKTKKRDESCQTEQTEDEIYKTGALIQVARLNGYKRTPVVASSQHHLHLHSHLSHQHLPHSSSQPATASSSKIEFRAEVHREDDKSSGGALNTRDPGSMCIDKGTSISGLRDSIRSEASVNESISQRLHHILTGHHHHQHHLNQSSTSDTRKLIKLGVDLSSPTSSTASTAINERCVDGGNPNSNGYNLTSPVPANSVKMRDIPAIKNAGDDGRSSSGNWSASSSTHASVDSDANQPHVSGQDRPSSQQLMPHSPSGSSLGKDSVISDSLTTSGHHHGHHQSNSHHHDHHHQHHHHDSIGNGNSSCHDQESRTGTAIDSNGYVSDTSAVSSSYAVMQRDELAKITGQSIMASVSSVVKRNNGHKAQIANRDSESWLKYFEDSSETLTPADGDGGTSDDGSCKTPRNLSNSRLVQGGGILRSQNSSTSNSSSILITATNGLASSSSSNTIRPDFPMNNHHLNQAIDDEAESVYSVDTDGYYTSMHTDSGLFRDSFCKLANPSAVAASSANGNISSKEFDKQSIIDSLRSGKDLRRDSISSVSTTGGTMGPTISNNEPLGKIMSPRESSSSYIQAHDQLGLDHHHHNHRRSSSSSSHNNNNANKMDENQLCKPPRLIPLPPLRSTSLLTSSRTLSSRASNRSLSTNSVSISSPINFSPSHNSSSVHHHTIIAPTDHQHHPASLSTVLTSASTTRSHSPSYPASESEQSELQMKERVKLKTCINPTDYPPLCNVTSSEASCSGGSCSNSDSSASIDSKSDLDDHSRRDGDGSNGSGGSRTSRFLSSYKAFKIKDIFKFSTLKRSRIKPRGSGSDLSKHPSLAFDHRLVNADKYVNLDDSYLHTHSQNNLHRASLSSESGSPTDHQMVNGKGERIISSSSVALSKCPSIEKNFVTTTNMQINSPPYMPKPLTDQNFFQTLMKKIDLRNLSEENVALQTSREHISDGGKQLTCGLPSPIGIKSKDSNYMIGGKNGRSVRPSTLILPYKINQRQVKVDIDSDGKVLYSSNSLGRRRDNHPMNYVDRIEKRTVEEDKKWLTMPIVSKSRSSSPLSLNCAANMIGLPHHNQDQRNHHHSLNTNQIPLSSTPRKPTQNTSSIAIDKSTSSSPFEVSQISNVTSEINPESIKLSSIHQAQSLSTDRQNSSPLSSLSHLSGKQGPPTFPKPRNCPNRHSFSGITKLQQNYRDYAEALIDSLIADEGNKKSSSLPTSGQPSIDSSGSDTAQSMVTVKSLSLENNNNNINNSLISNSPSTNMIDFIAESRRILSANSKLSPKSADGNNFNSMMGKNEILTSPCSDPGPSPVRRSTLIMPGQRRSWSFTSDQTDMMLRNMVENIPRSRRSLVMDRNGPLKPTNIDDFKRLLSNARFSTPIRGRISAKELLSSGPKLPSSLAYELGSAFVNDPSSPPDNRTRIINGRLYRSPYKLNAMYPPIEEDCGEELTRKSIENSKENSNEESVSECPETPVIATTTSNTFNDDDQLEASID